MSHLTSEEQQELSAEAAERLRKVTNIWFHYQEKLRIAQAATKRARAKMAAAEKSILKIVSTMPDQEYFMKDPNDPDADYMFQMRRKVFTRKIPINEKTIRSALTEVYEDPSAVDELVAKIKSKQGTKEVVAITQHRKKRSLIDG